MVVAEKVLYEIRRNTRLTLFAILFLCILMRSVDVVLSLMAGDETRLLSFPLTALFPALLIVMLAAMPPAASREGALMRLGTMIQLVAIIALPDFALYLALGLPVVFLVVELFETKLTASLREPIARMVVR